MKIERRHIKPNTILYLSRPFENVQKIVVATAPRKDKYAGVPFTYVLGEGPRLHLKTACLGDLGVTGYAYDDRPCQIHATREEAVAAHQASKDWLRKPKALTSDIRRAGRRYGH
ncbi:hypothetical protein [Xanthomonas phage Carpasina]|uniref:Uncharacterized protein n=1 Tax=Xanthomonas phage Carpasina TaxID=2163636 RepID=A0A2S1GSY0_9CAUD|nr:hypothetical protein HOT16_gp64 [Xanthomonas phage Carpasina]AWD92459.1 hypothetical protein [Xanthomonas phage Carpasina]